MEQFIYPTNRGFSRASQSGTTVRITFLVQGWVRDGQDIPARPMETPMDVLGELCNVRMDISATSNFTCVFYLLKDYKLHAYLYSTFLLSRHNYIYVNRIPQVAH
jgi:hypothetical protein